MFRTFKGARKENSSLENEIGDEPVETHKIEYFHIKYREALYKYSRGDRSGWFSDVKSIIQENPGYMPYVRLWGDRFTREMRINALKKYENVRKNVLRGTERLLGS